MTVMSFLIALCRREYPHNQDDSNVCDARDGLEDCDAFNDCVTLDDGDVFDGRGVDMCFISDALHTVMSIGTQSMSAMSMMALNTVRP